MARENVKFRIQTLHAHEILLVVYQKNIKFPMRYVIDYSWKIGELKIAMNAAG